MSFFCALPETLPGHPLQKNSFSRLKLYLRPIPQLCSDIKQHNIILYANSLVFRNTKEILWIKILQRKFYGLKSSKAKSYSINQQYFF